MMCYENQLLVRRLSAVSGLDWNSPRLLLHSYTERVLLLTVLSGVSFLYLQRNETKS